MMNDLKQQTFQQLPSESVEQICLFRWADFESWKHPELELMFHIPNGGKRCKTTAKRLKAEGVKAGVPDICLPVSRGSYHGLYIEMKKLKGNKATKNQNEWIEKLRKQGYAALVCYGWEEASNVILEYLNLKSE
jgi:hypothetical protein